MVEIEAVTVAVVITTFDDVCCSVIDGTSNRYCFIKFKNSAVFGLLRHPL